MSDVNELEEKCRHLIAESGIDGRTCYFAGALGQPGSIIHLLQDGTRLKPALIERILEGFASQRYADFFERRAHGLDYDGDLINFLFSQGYKRGLKWRGVPLGKTCWDISIYQQLLQELRPKTIIEFGTGLGASALFFHDHCHMFGLEAKVITLDINANDVSPKVRGEKAIEFIHGDVAKLTELLPIERLRALPHPWLIVEDCHTHVPLIVRHLEPLMATGDYLVLEDIGTSAIASQEIRVALQGVPKGTLMVDTFYTDMFGRNTTCCPDSIFRKM
jgi:cephalosporin hydroxylase